MQTWSQGASRIACGVDDSRTGPARSKGISRENVHGVITREAGAYPMGAKPGPLCAMLKGWTTPPGKAP